MTMTLPPALGTAFAVLGVPWPDEDEDGLRCRAAAYRTCATGLSDDVAPTAHAAVQHVAANNSGDHIDELTAYWAEYQNDAGHSSDGNATQSAQQPSGADAADPGHLTNLAITLHGLADFHELLAFLVEVVKIALIVLASYVALAIAWAALTAFVSAGASALEARSLIAALRILAQRFVTVFRDDLATNLSGMLSRGVYGRLVRILEARGLTAGPRLGELATFGLRTAALGTALAFHERPQHRPLARRLPDPVKSGARFALGEYRIGSATPRIGFDNDFPYDPHAKPTPKDYLSWYTWRARLRGGELLRPGLDDALVAYQHYMDGTGTDLQVDYEKAYSQDASIRIGVDTQLAQAKDWAEKLYRKSGKTDFEMTGGLQPQESRTENWLKTLGAHMTWTSAQVNVQGDKVKMDVTVHAEDMYNFNKGSADLATGLPDNDNGRFETLGWAKSFRTHGTLHRTLTWTLRPIR